MKSSPMQGTKSTGKTAHENAALGDPTMYPKGIKANGGHQAASKPTMNPESNHETLRHGNKPKPEAVKHMASEDGDCLAKARKYNERSMNGNANPMAAAQGVKE